MEHMFTNCRCRKARASISIKNKYGQKCSSSHICIQYYELLKLNKTSIKGYYNSITNSSVENLPFIERGY